MSDEQQEQDMNVLPSGKTWMTIFLLGLLVWWMEG